jgi:hypothetical protein
MGSRGNLRDKAISYTVAEGDEHHNNERGQHVTNVSPVDLRDLANHHAPHLHIDQQFPCLFAYALTNIRVHPVAHGGTEAKIGAKKTDTMKHSPVTMAVSPVRPPSAMPAPLSMKAVTGDEPNIAPIDMKAASVQYATVDLGKSPSLGSTTPQKRTIEYRVAVASIMSTYKKVNNARTNCPP